MHVVACVRIFLAPPCARAVVGGIELAGTAFAGARSWHKVLSHLCPHTSSDVIQRGCIERPCLSLSEDSMDSLLP